MSKSPKEKAVDKALRRLSPMLIDKMDGYTVCVGLYGMGKLTLREYECIRTASNVRAANSELFSTFQKRGPDILDNLLEVLEDEDDANAHLITKIKEGIITTIIIIIVFCLIVCIVYNSFFHNNLYISISLSSDF